VAQRSVYFLDYPVIDQTHRLKEGPFPFGLTFENSVRASRIDRLTYAIGDVHGRNDLLLKLLDEIQSDAKALSERPRIVFLGDYIDRGSESDRVIDTLIRLKVLNWCDVITLMGNHEKTLLNFLHSPHVYGPRWLEYGGFSTFRSYGITPPASSADLHEWETAKKALIEALPSDHINLFVQMPFSFTAGDYFFVHAGVDPSIHVSLQGPETLLWIRSSFLKAERACDYVVVHGHTADTKATITRWRIGIDTGAYATGVLSTIRLKDGTRHLMQVR
jgi:serine/threonine protein phosphatase 1